jgi:hypothetical protein
VQRLFSYRQGDRAEYLAQYLLSAIAISIPVPRQEDTGDDFHCSLLRRLGGNLFPYLPFHIQIKRHSRSLIRKGIVFCGVTKRGKWREEGIKKLCDLHTPLLIGLVNPTAQWMEIFSTIPRIFVAKCWDQRPRPREVVMLPYQPEDENHIGCGTVTDLPARAGMPNGRWALPIGNPILRMTIQDSESRQRCEEIKQLLEPYILLDQQNAIFHRLGISTFEWPLIMRTGMARNETGVGAMLVPPDSEQFKPSLAVLCKIIANMLKAYQNRNQPDQIRPWLPLLPQLPFAEASPFARDMVVQVQEYMATNPVQAHAPLAQNPPPQPL